MKTFTATPKTGKRQPAQQLQKQIGTITPEQFARGEAYWTGRRRLGHRRYPSEVIKPLPESLDEALLPDVMIGLHDVYGTVFPKPEGEVILFTVVDLKTTYEKAAIKIQRILAQQKLQASSLTIKPGPEIKIPTNRKITITLAKNTLM